MKPVRCLLWDFGDTLCDERFIWASGPEWMNVYQTFDDGLGAAWSLGEIDTQQFAAELSRRMGRSAESVVAHMTERCRHIEFFPRTYEFFRARHVPQAIVTVNPDLFSHVVVPLCAFDDVCDAIVTSWEEGTIDKRVLCRLALERLGEPCPPSEALLIDDKRSNVDDWVGVGGAGHLYTDDVSFARDSANGPEGLAGA